MELADITLFHMANTDDGFVAIMAHNSSAHVMANFEHIIGVIECRIEQDMITTVKAPHKLGMQIVARLFTSRHGATVSYTVEVREDCTIFSAPSGHDCFGYNADEPEQVFIEFHNT